jgi:hypothetical protein
MSWLATRPDAVLAPPPSEVLECLPRFMHEKEKLFLEWGGDPPWADVLLLGMKVAHSADLISTNSEILAQ